MNSKRALILDLDFTLLHLEYLPGSIEVPGRTRSAWLAPQTVEILRVLQPKFEIVLATARSYDGTRWVVDGLEARGVEVVGLVIEDGARLGNAGDLRAFEPDFEVEKLRVKLELKRAIWPDFEWQLDFESCVVARCEHGEDAAKLLGLSECESEIRAWNPRFFRDGRKVYILPRGANKWSALQQLLGARAQRAAGVGDGENDLIWLPKVADPATFSRAKTALVDAVRARNGYVSGLDGHDGIAEILARWI